jgi:hypothetical protein
MQNDTFFYIPIGKYIAETGKIDGLDHWSFHENLRFTYPGWVCNLVSYLIYSKWGFAGIYVLVLIFTALIAVALFNTLLKANKSLIISFVATIVSIYFSSGVFTDRNQIYSFLAFILELYALDGLLERGKKKYFWILILLSIVLVNVHDTLYPLYFVIMLPYLAEIIWAKLNLFHIEGESYKIELSNFKNQKYLIVLMIICIFTGLMTPLFGTAYTNMIECMSGISTQFIAELQQLNIFKEPFYMCLLALTIIIIGFTKTKVKLKDLLFSFGFFVFALIAIRDVYFLYLIGIVSITNIFVAFLKTYLGEESIEKIDNFFIDSDFKIILIVVLVGGCAAGAISSQLTGEYIDDLSYPVEATEWILNNVDLDEARIWTGFNYGSYLELNGIKVFLDSRSGMYCDEVNKGVTILSDWLNVEKGNTSYDTIFDKYGITHALITNTNIINQYIYTNEDYELIYQDDVFSLYERKE